MAVDWKGLGVVTGALIGVWTIGTYAAPYFRSDAAPLAGIARVDNVAKELKSAVDNGTSNVMAVIVRGNILGMWRAKCDAVHDRNRQLALQVEGAILALQTDYMKLTGLEYPLLSPCPA